MQYSTYKRLIRKGKQGPAPGPQSHHVNCDICGKLCLSLADLKSHLRKCAKSILHSNIVTLNKTGWLCQFCGKICRSLAGLKSHLRTHTIYGVGGRNEIKEVVTFETERTAITTWIKCLGWKKKKKKKKEGIWELWEEAACCFEQILKAATYKHQLHGHWSPISNNSGKTKGTAEELRINLHARFSNGLLHMDTPA